METLELKNMATQVRRDIVRMVHAVQSGHPGGSLGCADFLTALYFKIMEHSNNFSIVNHGNPVGQRKNFIKISGNQQHRFLLISCLHKALMDKLD